MPSSLGARVTNYPGAPPELLQRPIPFGISFTATKTFPIVSTQWPQPSTTPGHGFRATTIPATRPSPVCGSTSSPRRYGYRFAPAFQLSCTPKLVNREAIKISPLSEEFDHCYSGKHEAIRTVFGELSVAEKAGLQTS